MNHLRLSLVIVKALYVGAAAVLIVLIFVGAVSGVAVDASQVACFSLELLTSRVLSLLGLQKYQRNFFCPIAKALSPVMQA